ncbi:hypothetical protein NBRC116594_28300 [Shimia sp. NS0008-38b]|uniref:hypothetical protein n=1 Tax=Shimia sp. NS0008-38b TaxID=3127653 RepID=UPI00310B499F
MTGSTPFDLNGYILDVPPTGKFAANAPPLGASWPSSDGTQCAAAWIIYPFIKTDAMTPESLMSNIWSIGDGHHVRELGSQSNFAWQEKYTGSTFFVLRPVTMHYVWRAIIVDLNTAGGYSQDQTFQTGVQTSSETTTTFGETLGAEASGKVPLLGGIGLKLTAAYNAGSTTKNATVLTQSSSVTQHIKADPNQTFVQWQLFTRHHIAPPILSGIGDAEPDLGAAFYKAFDESGYAAANPAVEIEQAPLLASGQGVYSATMYPAQ